MNPNQIAALLMVIADLRLQVEQQGVQLAQQAETIARLQPEEN